MLRKLYFQDVCECTEEGCQECCEHVDTDHFICIDCGKELDPGDAIDKATDAIELSLADYGY